tara:strand:+ start:571 stop:963 length:393 start_codon:yes stop_codon:yes gene_type:complete
MNDTTTQTVFIPNRRQRRTAMAHQGLLKQKSKLSLAEWYKLCSEIKIKGNEIHEANIERDEKSNFARLEEIESVNISNWKEEGYTDKEIEQLREAYSIFMIKDKSTWHKDKKVARKIIKELSSTLYNRKS